MNESSLRQNARIIMAEADVFFAVQGEAAPEAASTSPS